MNWELNMNWKTFFKSLMLSGMLLVASNAHSVVDCTGTVLNLSLALNATGEVTLSLSGGPTVTYLCTIDGPGLNGVSTAVCRSMYATLMAAKLTGKKVLIRFNDYNTCSAVPAWAPAGSVGWTQLLLD